MIECFNNHILTLPFTHIPETPLARSAFWLKSTAATGQFPPTFIVHDLGFLISTPRNSITITRPEYIPEDINTDVYFQFLKRLEKNRLLCDVSLWNLSDNVIGAIIAKLITGIEFPEAYRLPKGINQHLFYKHLSYRLDHTNPEQVWKKAIASQRPDIHSLISQEKIAKIEENLNLLDRDELQFMQLYGTRFFNRPDPRELLDLFSLMDLPKEVKRIISQVLRLIPRVSQSIKRSGAQTYAMGGYEGMTRKGNFDSLVLTELAFPQDIFLHRLLNYEALYYGREGDQDQKKELAYIITQSGIEMLGDRAILSQGLTLALSNAMQNRGYEVCQSFVGSQFTEASEIKNANDIHRIVYYQDNGLLQVEQMLESVINQVKMLKSDYRDIQIFWIISENWDLDELDEHIELYQVLKSLAGHQAWFIGVKETESGYQIKPDSAGMFHRYHLVSNELMWSDERFLTKMPEIKEVDVDVTPKRRYYLRSEAITASVEEFVKVFKLDDNWRPLEYKENDYEDKGDIVLDHATGLMWEKSGSSDEFFVSETQEYIQALNKNGFAGYKDWRLPTIDELISLLEPEKQSNNLFIY